MTYHYSRPNSTQNLTASRPQSLYTQNLTSLRPQSLYTQNLTSSRPQSVYTQTLTQSPSTSRPYPVHHQRQSSATSRPHSVVGYEGYEGFSSLQPQSSFRVIRRRQQRKNSRNNMLNPTLDNFYNMLRRTEADLSVNSAKDWVREYEPYRRQVLNAEKTGVDNARRPVSCYSSTLVSSPDTSRYSMFSM